MARPRKTKPIQFPGSFDRFHVLARNVEGEGTATGFVIITVDPDFLVKISTNYDKANKNERRFIANQLVQLAQEIANQEE